MNQISWLHNNSLICKEQVMTATRSRSIISQFVVKVSSTKYSLISPVFSTIWKLNTSSFPFVSCPQLARGEQIGLTLPVRKGTLYTTLFKCMTTFESFSLEEFLERFSKIIDIIITVTSLKSCVKLHWTRSSLRMHPLTWLLGHPLREAST